MLNAQGILQLVVLGLEEQRLAACAGASKLLSLFPAYPLQSLRHPLRTGARDALLPAQESVRMRPERDMDDEGLCQPAEGAGFYMK
jgi:hypothetical protein